MNRQNKYNETLQWGREWKARALKAEAECERLRLLANTAGSDYHEAHAARLKAEAECAKLGEVIEGYEAANKALRSRAFKAEQALREIERRLEKWKGPAQNDFSVIYDIAHSALSEKEE